MNPGQPHPFAKILAGLFSGGANNAQASDPNLFNRISSAYQRHSNEMIQEEPSNTDNNKFSTLRSSMQNNSAPYNLGNENIREVEIKDNDPETDFNDEYNYRKKLAEDSEKMSVEDFMKKHYQGHVEPLENLYKQKYSHLPKNDFYDQLSNAKLRDINGQVMDGYYNDIREARDVSKMPFNTFKQYRVENPLPEDPDEGEDTYGQF